MVVGSNPGNIQQAMGVVQTKIGLSALADNLAAQVTSLEVTKLEFRNLRVGLRSNFTYGR